MGCQSTKCSKCGILKPACQLINGMCVSCAGGTNDIVSPIVNRQVTPCDTTRTELELVQTKIQCIIQNGFQDKISMTPTEMTQALSKVNNLLKGYNYCQNPIWLIELKAIQNAIIINTSC